jgi:hypothetical protein
MDPSEFFTLSRSPTLASYGRASKTAQLGPAIVPARARSQPSHEPVAQAHLVLYGPPWAHCLGGYQDRLLGGPPGLPDLRCTAPDGVMHKVYGGEILG